MCIHSTTSVCNHGQILHSIQCVFVLQQVWVTMARYSTVYNVYSFNNNVCNHGQIIHSIQCVFILTSVCNHGQILQSIQYVFLLQQVYVTIARYHRLYAYQSTLSMYLPNRRRLTIRPFYNSLCQWVNAHNDIQKLLSLPFDGGVKWTIWDNGWDILYV